MDKDELIVKKKMQENDGKHVGHIFFKKFSVLCTKSFKNKRKHLISHALLLLFYFIFVNMGFMIKRLEASYQIDPIAL